MNLKVVLKPSDQGGFRAFVPNLPGCDRRGMNEEEALANVRTAVLQHFGIEEVLHAPHGYPYDFSRMGNNNLLFG
ncbi:MAG: type II toxin-antitoxin system HicB family antitoxin [Nitrospiria bacterium]